MAKYPYRDTAFGEAVYPHLNKPDSKFNPQSPAFKTGLRLKGEEAQKQKAIVDAAAEAAFADFFENGEGKGMKPAEKNKFSVYRPYEEETDDDGNLTGAIVFDYKQNATIRMSDGSEPKVVVIGIYDASGKESDKLIRNGSEIRINYSLRPIPMKSLKQVGVRADFGRVQYRKLAKGTGGGFGAVDGEVDDNEAEPDAGQPVERSEY